MYLLAKKLPHTLVSGENDEFKKLLKDTKAEEVVRFAEAVKSADPTIDGQVCAKLNGTKSSGTRTKCDNSGDANKGTDKEANLSSYASAVLKGADGAKKWPVGNDSEASSEKMASDLFGLQRHEKAKVAGLLSKTITSA